MWRNQESIAGWSQYPREQIKAFGQEGDFSRRYLLNPHLFNLLGDVTRKHILDAGCGTGYLSRLMQRAGALVTGIEPATSLYQYCLEQEDMCPQQILYYQEDVSSSKLLQHHHFDQYFDVVVLNMVLMDIPDWEPALKNCVHGLKSGGQLIISLSHPCFDEDNNAMFLELGYVRVTDYFHIHQQPVRYGINVHRPLQTYINTCLSHGLTLTRLLEPQLAPDIANQHPEAIRNLHVPSFILLDWHKK